MRPVAVVVWDPRPEDLAEVAFVERDAPVQPLTAHRSDRALAQRIGLRSSRRSLEGDTVLIVDRSVSVNGRPLEDDYL